MNKKSEASLEHLLKTKQKVEERLKPTAIVCELERQLKQQKGASKRLLRCFTCHRGLYCSTRCMRLDRALHKKNCSEESRYEAEEDLRCMVRLLNRSVAPISSPTLEKMMSKNRLAVTETLEKEALSDSIPYFCGSFVKKTFSTEDLSKLATASSDEKKFLSAIILRQRKVDALNSTLVSRQIFVISLESDLSLTKKKPSVIYLFSLG